jgi:protein-L-isoaspartate(D-aspartate) O-methyltransferase
MAPRVISRAVLLTALATVPLVAQPSDTQLAAARRQMVDRQIASRDVKDRRVLDAMRRVERHRFVPAALLSRAYDDTPLPIGYDQTISQPYVVAYMSEALGVERQHKVLEIGTGSGYRPPCSGSWRGRCTRLKS